MVARLRGQDRVVCHVQRNPTDSFPCAQTFDNVGMISSEQPFGDLRMPIIKYKGKTACPVKPAEINPGDFFSLFGTEAEQLETLLARIRLDQSIASFLEKIPADYLLFFLNVPMQHRGWFDGRLFTPTHAAAYYGNKTALTELHHKGADLRVNTILRQGPTPLEQDSLCLAAVNNQAHIVTYLLTECQLKPTPFYLNALLYECVRFGRIETAETLLLLGADVNYKNSNGHSLVHAACEHYLDSDGGSDPLSSGLTRIDHLFRVLLHHKTGISFFKAPTDTGKGMAPALKKSTEYLPSL